MSIYIIGFHFTCTCTTTCEYAVLLGSKITVPFGSNLIYKKKTFPHHQNRVYEYLHLLPLNNSKYMAFLAHFLCCHSLFEHESRTWFQKTTKKKNHDSFKLWIRVAKSWEYTEKHWLFSKLVISMIIYQVWSHFKNKK